MYPKKWPKSEDIYMLTVRATSFYTAKRNHSIHQRMNRKIKCDL